VLLQPAVLRLLPAGPRGLHLQRPFPGHPPHDLALLPALARPLRERHPPVLGSWEVIPQLLALDPIPEIPIDPATRSRDPAVGAAYAEDPLVWHGPFKRTTPQALATALDTSAESATDSPLPTLWIHGSDDQLVPLSGTRPGIEAVKGSDFEEIIYPEARHEVFNETNKDQVLADVTAFIDRALGSGHAQP